jgi:hypothetical protein
MTWSDWLRSVVRTVLPGVWSAFVLWLVSLGLPQGFTDWLNSETVVTHVFELASFAVVYGFIRWVEPHIPDWLTRVFLGSAKQPQYDLAA